MLLNQLSQACHEVIGLKNELIEEIIHAHAKEEGDDNIEEDAAQVESLLCTPVPCARRGAQREEKENRQRTLREIDEATANIRRDILVVELNKSREGVQVLPSGLQIQFKPRRPGAPTQKNDPRRTGLTGIR